MRWCAVLAMLGACDAVASSGATKVVFESVTVACVEDERVEVPLPADAAGVVVERETVEGVIRGGDVAWVRTVDGVEIVQPCQPTTVGIRASWLVPG